MIEFWLDVTVPYPSGVDEQSGVFKRVCGSVERTIKKKVLNYRYVKIYKNGIENFHYSVMNGLYECFIVTPFLRSLPIVLTFFFLPHHQQQPLVIIIYTLLDDKLYLATIKVKENQSKAKNLKENFSRFVSVFILNHAYNKTIVGTKRI
jgi:hypothetical protein